jgi:hypothetical protein
MVSLLLILACGGENEAPGEQSQDPEIGNTELIDLPALQLLTRASMDLRGVRPSIAELEALEAEPDSVGDLISSFIDGDLFGEQLRSNYANIYLTKLDYYYVGADDYGLSDEPGFARSIGEETLRILSHIAEEDLPYTEIVAGDWTMANELLGAAWPVTYPEDGSGWLKVSYTDKRPTAGILSTNSLWWRYMSNTSNANRNRANAVSRILLCNDYLNKPIEFDRSVNLLDDDAVRDALKTNPGCAACHHSLDPLASYLWGFYYVDYDSAQDTTTYHPEREFMWEDYSGVAPGYYGEEGFILSDLGQQLAADPGLIECAVEQAYSIFLGRSSTIEDTAQLTAHREVFVESGLKLKALYRSVLADPNYRADPNQEGSGAAIKMVTTDQMASQIEDLTGFRFQYYGYDMMSTDSYGLRTLAGGVDGNLVTAPATNPTATMLLVQERLAQTSAWYVTTNDALSEEPRLFTKIDFHETPTGSKDRIVAQIQNLHFRIFGQRVAEDGPEVAANLALWSELFAVDGSSVNAWAGLLSVLFRDPEFLTY